jgi:hypothetical protein
MSDEETPPADAIARAKADFPNREVERVVLADGDKEYVFLMVSPNREEWRRFRREMVAAGTDLEKIEQAIEFAALRSIQWPSRDDVKALFDSKPGIIQNFAEPISKLAGSHVEVVAKKL